MAVHGRRSAVDPAVRMALTPEGWSKEYLHGYSVENSYHMSVYYISYRPQNCQELYSAETEIRFISSPPARVSFLHKSVKALRFKLLTPHGSDGMILPIRRCLSAHFREKG